MSYTSDSDYEVSHSQAKLFGRQRPIHAVLGSRKVADVLLWRDTKVSTSILIAITAIWFLFEVVEYNFVPLVCHIVITTMLLNFIYNKLAETFEWEPPRIKDNYDGSAMLRELISALTKRFNQLVDIASGSNFQTFLLTVVVLYIISVLGNYVSFVNLVFLGCLSMLTLPYLYERYEEDVDRLFGDVSLELKRIFRRFDRKVLNRIPRGPVKEKKHR